MLHFLFRTSVVVLLSQCVGAFRIEPFTFPENATDRYIVNPWNGHATQSEYEWKNPAGDYATSLMESAMAKMEVNNVSKTAQFNSWESRQWPGATLHYYFAKSASHHIKEVVKMATKEISRVTCINFKDWTDKPGSLPESVVHITSTQEGCFYSQPGYARGAGMRLNLEEPGCDSVPTAIHELLHALGFAHEHERNDRDKYITIEWGNIKEGPNIKMQFQLNKEWTKLTGAREDDMGFKYDYKSIMHYDAWAFSRCSRLKRINKDVKCVTMMPKNKSLISVIGQRKGLSRQDVKELYTYYHCHQSGNGEKPDTKKNDTNPPDVCYDQYPDYCGLMTRSAGVDIFKKYFCADREWSFYCRGTCDDCKRGKPGTNQGFSNTSYGRTTLNSLRFALIAVLLFQIG